MGAFPVKRDTADMTSIKRAVRMLKRRELVGILPEGTRRGKTDRVPSIHAGVSVIARMAKVPILPMTVRGVERIKQGQRVHFPKVTVDYGDPILVGDFDFLPKDERVEACTWYAMRECFALYYRCAPEDVDMAALFPETRGYAPVFAEHPIPRHTSEELARAARTARAESRQGRRESEGELAVEVIRAKRAGSLLRGAAGAGYGRRGHCRWWAGLHARAAHSQPAGGGRSGRSRRQEPSIPWRRSAGRCRGSERSCGRSRLPSRGCAGGGHPLPWGDAPGAGRRGGRGFSVVDATCPHVSRAQHAAAELCAAEGCRVIVVGEAGHPEVEGLTAWAERSRRQD